MSVQYTDGSFSDNMPFGEALDEFNRAVDIGTARSLHVGTELELNRIKEREKLIDEMQSLEERLSKLEEGPLKSESIVLPTRDEMIYLLRSNR